MSRLALATLTLLAPACSDAFSAAVEPPVPALTVYSPSPVLGVGMGDTVEVAEPTATGGVPPYAWAYSARDPYLHVVSRDPLRVYASDGGHPKIVATVHDASGLTETVEIEVRVQPRARAEGRWHMAHLLHVESDTVQLIVDLMPGNPWCPDTYKGQCTNPNCATASDGYPGYPPCPQRSFNISGQVKWTRGGHDIRMPHQSDVFWPDPFVWLPWPRTSFVNAQRVLLNIGVPEEVGVCERGTYAEFDGTLNGDATELTGTLTYECSYLLPGIPNTALNPTGNVTFYRQEGAI